MKIDVVLLTKNSIKPCLKECLESIYANVPVNRLIVVDGGSNDGTIDLLKKYPNVDIIDDSNGNRATARQKGIEAVETEWHLHVDSDVVLCRDWFLKVKPLMQEKVGAIWGVEIPMEKYYLNLNNFYCKLVRFIIRFNALKRLKNNRYFTHDTLFRTKLLKNITIPKNLQIFEDHYIGRQITSKGYRFLRTNEVYCFHYARGRDASEEFFLNGYLMHKYGIMGLRHVLMRFATIIPEVIWILISRRKLKNVKIQVKILVLTIKGWLSYYDE